MEDMYHNQIVQDSYEKNVRNAHQARTYQSQYPPQNVPQYPPQGDVYGRRHGK